MDQKLADLLHKKQKQSNTGESIDWDDRRQSYLQAVGELYTLIETVFADPIQDGTVKLRRRSKSLTEDHIGTYAADDLVLLIGDEQVRFSRADGTSWGPRAGSMSSVSTARPGLILRDSAWWLVQSRQPTLRIIRLNESSFADVLNLVMRD